ncbi:AI-2E family transporter [Tropicimonas isoalkanivorans]|uniref:Predicted PurR-regulated permease PerM n=1 Tax=Tropicimonas isoalkanivorans TaxID=441112 RepID=A0A1I1DX37_9RHOB|nr:AI-2E family transporter [Tropicimonas isoalkanivorans]SFB79505.1 Predicted PurR-regulated permease PerM [Tropicimonas isoalkanivorans]
MTVTPPPPGSPSRPAIISPDAFRWTALVLVTALTTLLFFAMIRGFLISLIMAAIIAEMSRPAYRRIRAHVGGHRNIAAAITLALIIGLVIVPVLMIGTVAAEQALALPRTVVRVLDGLAQQSQTWEMPEWLPFDEDMEHVGPEVVSKVGDLVTAIARYMVGTMSAVTRGTALLFLDIFIFLYALFFFVKMEVPVMKQVLHFTALAPETQHKLADRAVSVSRATLKGVVVIGIVQGILGGIGFWVAGIEGATFWGVVMAILSIIPGLGPGLVLAVGCLYLFAAGNQVAAIGLGLWAGLVVTTIDNFLRPILVGRDTQMHDILILVSTFGGLGMFGAVGLVLGPVVAGVFVTIWTTLAEAMMANTKSTQAEDQITAPPAPASPPAPRSG